MYFCRTHIRKKNSAYGKLYRIGTKIPSRYIRIGCRATRVDHHLKNAIATGKLAHAYLFCGPRGVGKQRVHVSLPRPSTARPPLPKEKPAISVSLVWHSTNSVLTTYMSWMPPATTR